MQCTGSEPLLWTSLNAHPLPLSKSLMPFSVLDLVTPKLSPIFDLKLVITSSLAFLCVSPFLTDNLNRVSLCMFNALAAAAEVIYGVVGVVDVATYRVPTIK